MERILTLLFATIVVVAQTFSQTCDLVFFTDDGTKFTLIVDGDVKNPAPATRVVATGIRTETPVIMVKFEDASIPQIKKPGYFELGKEHTVMITTNKKGERVLRPTGEAALGTAAANEPAPAKPTTFVEDAPATTTQTTTTTGVATGGTDQITTTTTIEETDELGDSENVNFNMGVNGMGVNMNVQVTDGTGTTTGSSTTRTTTTRTTTTTTTTGGSTGTTTAATPVKEPEVYRMPGYSGPIGCAWPMTPTEFDDAKKSIESKGFEESKMTMAKQIGRDRCFTVDQVKGIMTTFGFEDTKLDFAKFAYDRTYDIGNYYKVNDSFSFESSIDELNSYIQGR
jgi:hypothetical protein